MVCLVWGSTCLWAVEADTASWPQFRGPTGQGLAADAALPLTWSESQGIRWKTPLPGRGWSSPVIANGRIWVTAAVDRPATDAADTAAAPSLPALELLALEIDLATGELLRRVNLFTLDSPAPVASTNSYASPTPVLERGKLYCHFGSFGTACVDVNSGNVDWRQRLEINHSVGPGSSPVLIGNSLVITCDGTDRQFIAALDASDGAILWQKDRPPIREPNPEMHKAFCTPLAIESAGRAQAVIPGAQWFVAYDPLTGEEIWSVDHGRGYSNVPSPIYDGERLYLCTGYDKPQLWGVRADGSGNVTETHVDWRQKQQIPTMSSPVVSDGRIYTISEAGVASCFETKTGDLIWRKRIAGNYSASPLLGAGRIYFCSHEGMTTVVAASAEFQELAANQLDGMLMASPAAAAGDLILRTDSHLYRIGGE